MNEQEKARVEALEAAVRALTEQVAIMQDRVGLVEDIISETQGSLLRPVSPKVRVPPRPSVSDLPPVPPEKLEERRKKLKEIIDKFDISNYLKKKPDK